jgi:hypothetical protein
MMQDEPLQQPTPTDNNLLGINFLTPDISNARKHLPPAPIQLPNFKKHPKAILDMQPIDFLICLKDEPARLFHPPSFIRHLQFIAASNPHIDPSAEVEEILTKHLSNCHIPTAQTMKNSKLTNAQEQSRPRNVITKGVKTPEQGIGSAVLLRAHKGGELIKILTRVGPYIYKDQSYRIIAANKLATEFIIPAPQKKEKRTLTAKVPYWLSDSIIFTHLCDPAHPAHDKGITFWQTRPHPSGDPNYQTLRLEFKRQYLRDNFLEDQEKEHLQWTIDSPPTNDDSEPPYHTLAFQKEEVEFPILMDLTAPIKTPTQNPNAGLKKVNL